MKNQISVDSIKEHEDAINNPESAIFFNLSPEKVLFFKERDKKELNEKLDILDAKFEKLTPYIKQIKNHISTITEKTQKSACYLIFHKVIQSWEALMLLARQGFYYESMEMLRSIGENLDLVHLFINDKDSKNLANWFNGDIIEHSKSRDKFDEVVNEAKILDRNVDFKSIKTKIYRTFSQYTHGGYVAMLESINVFSKDFDFDKTAGYHRLNETFSSFESLFTNIVFTLSNYNLLVCLNLKNVDELNIMLPKPAFTKEELTEHIRKNKL